MTKQELIKYFDTTDSVVSTNFPKFAAAQLKKDFWLQNEVRERPQFMKWKEQNHKRKIKVSFPLSQMRLPRISQMKFGKKLFILHYMRFLISAELEEKERKD